MLFRSLGRVSFVLKRLNANLLAQNILPQLDLLQLCSDVGGGNVGNNAISVASAFRRSWNLLG